MKTKRSKKSYRPETSTIPKQKTTIAIPLVVYKQCCQRALETGDDLNGWLVEVIRRAALQEKTAVSNIPTRQKDAIAVSGVTTTEKESITISDAHPDARAGDADKTQ